MSAPPCPQRTEDKIEYLLGLATDDMLRCLCSRCDQARYSSGVLNLHRMYPRSGERTLSWFTRDLPQPCFYLYMDDFDNRKESIKRMLEVVLSARLGTRSIVVVNCSGYRTLLLERIIVLFEQLEYVEFRFEDAALEEMRHGIEEHEVREKKVGRESFEYRFNRCAFTSLARRLSQEPRSQALTLDARQSPWIKGINPLVVLPKRSVWELHYSSLAPSPFDPFPDVRFESFAGAAGEADLKEASSSSPRVGAP